MNLFAYGFRVFFLLSGVSALLLVMGWVCVLLGFHSPMVSDPVSWHAHEMLFGFVGAMIAGFLLTAVPNWTGEKARQGLPLVVLSGLWLAARLLLLFSDSHLGGLVDLAFFPALLALLVPPLVRAKQPKTLVFVPILTALWFSNLMMHLESWRIAETRSHGLSLGVSLIILLIALIGGRVVPFFTRTALQTEPRQYPKVEALSALTILLLPLLEVLQPRPSLVVTWSFLAVLVHSVRLWGWTSAKIWRIPLLWVLHVGYAWLIVGLALKGLAAVGLAYPASAVHAFTAGAMGVMGLGIMSRASLGHTGRPLKASSLTTCSFVLINLAALLRVFGPPAGLRSFFSYGLSGGLWCLSFLLFLWVYSPILVAPRADGKPG